MIQSCFYKCEVYHKRLSPKVYAFKYKTFMTYLDLDELSSLDKKHLWFKYNRFGILSFWDKDHWQGNHPDAKRNLLDFFAAQGIRFAEPKVSILTLPRLMGYVFNPVSFYFIKDKDGSCGCAAEVNNTFGEQKLYLLNPEDYKDDHFQAVKQKNYYISPFISADAFLHFKIAIPDECLSIRLQDSQKGQVMFHANATGCRVALSTKQLILLFLSYPMSLWSVWTAIHWHALRLWMMKIPFYAKQDQLHLQTGVQRAYEKK